MKTLKESLLADMDTTLSSVNDYDAARVAISEFISDNYDINKGYRIKKRPNSDGKWVVGTRTNTIIYLKDTATQLNNGMFVIDKCEDFRIDGNHNITDLEGMPLQVNVLRITDCPNLKSLKGCPDTLKHLDCTMCNNLCDASGITKIDEISLWYCNFNSLKMFSNIQCKVLRSMGCNNIKTLEGCENVQDKIGIKALTDNYVNLETLKGCPKKLSEMELYKVNITDFVGAPEKVDFFSIYDAPRLNSLKGLPKTVNQRLAVSDCKALISKYGSTFDLRIAIQKYYDSINGHVNEITTYLS